VTAHLPLFTNDHVLNHGLKGYSTMELTRDARGAGSQAGIDAFPPLLSGRERLYSSCPVRGTMVINARGISGSDPGAVPGGSTKHPSLGADGAETGSTDV
jgi:hypothetical protein